MGVRGGGSGNADYMYDDNNNSQQLPRIWS